MTQYNYKVNANGGFEPYIEPGRPDVSGGFQNFDLSQGGALALGQGASGYNSPGIGYTNPTLNPVGDASNFTNFDIPGGVPTDTFSGVNPNQAGGDYSWLFGDNQGKGGNFMNVLNTAGGFGQLLLGKKMLDLQKRDAAFEMARYGQDFNSQVDVTNLELMNREEQRLRDKGGHRAADGSIDQAAIDEALALYGKNNKLKHSTI